MSQTKSTWPPGIVMPAGDEPGPRREWVPLDLNVTRELAESLDELAERHKSTPADEVARAVALYRFLTDRAREGKRVGVARADQELETEIKGLD